MRHVLAFLGERWEDVVLKGIQPEPKPQSTDLEAIEAAIENEIPNIASRNEESLHLSK